MSFSRNNNFNLNDPLVKLITELLEAEAAAADLINHPDTNDIDTDDVPSLTSVKFTKKPPEEIKDIMGNPVDVPEVNPEKNDLRGV